jgi:hypothetical protein
MGWIEFTEHGGYVFSVGAEMFHVVEEHVCGFQYKHILKDILVLLQDCFITAE